MILRVLCFIDLNSVLEEELRTIDSEKNATIQLYTTAREKEKRTSSELTTVNVLIEKLNVTQNQYKAQINELKDKIEANEAISVTIFVSIFSWIE